jgi:prolyl oligopeptidase
MVRLFGPSERKSMVFFSRTKNWLLVNELDNVKSRLYALQPQGATWKRIPLQAPEFGTLWASSVDEDESDEYFQIVTDFLTPDSLQLGVVGQSRSEVLKSSPSFFNAAGLEITQHEAVSKDGTRVPYFQVCGWRTGS